LVPFRLASAMDRHHRDRGVGVILDLAGNLIRPQQGGEIELQGLSGGEVGIGQPLGEKRNWQRW